MNDDIVNKGESKKAPPISPDQLPFKERVYSKIKIPMKALDTIIAVIIFLIIALTIVGAVIGNK